MKRRILKTLKKIGLSITSLILLIIIVGLGFRLFRSEPNPPGKMVDIGGFKLHIHSTGAKNHKPTLVIEAGAGGHSEYYYWLAENLKDSMRVVRYDRAGIGYSESGNTSRDPETIAHELHTLLENTGEAPPYIMAGHSHGGHYIRVFKDLYPDEVVGLVLIDSGHPDESERIPLPDNAGPLNTALFAGAVLGDLGILDMYVTLFGNNVMRAPGVPKSITDRYADYFRSGKYLWGVLEEHKWHESLKTMSKKVMEKDSLPIRVFAGTNVNARLLRKLGMNPDSVSAERQAMQREMAAHSTNGNAIFLDGGHFTIFTEKENANIICNEIIQLSRELGF